MSSLTMKDVIKKYGDLQVLHGINLEIQDGQFVVLLGPSGCGKSTLLRMLAGLEPISGGTVSIGDRVVNDVHPKDRNIAMVFQNYALYAHMTVRENMAFSMTLRKMDKAKIEERVQWAALQRDDRRRSAGALVGTTEHRSDRQSDLHQHLRHR
jgi:multiple sugar transport system ATP-binding protein